MKKFRQFKKTLLNTKNWELFYIKNPQHPLTLDDHLGTEIYNMIIKPNIYSIKQFVKLGANINSKHHGLTLFMIAVKYRQFELIKWLLYRGADHTIKESETGLTALDFAKGDYEYENIIKDLIANTS